MAVLGLKQSAALVRDDDGAILVFDATVSIAWTRSITVTDHPAETGVPRTDNAKPGPETVSIRGVVTEAPWEYLGGLAGPARVRAAKEWLKASEARSLTVVTSRYGTFTNMMITRHSGAQDSLARCEFRVDLKEAPFAEATLVSIPADLIASSDNGADDETSSAVSELPDAVDAGSQPTTDVTETEPEEVEADESVLLEMAQWLGLEE